MAKMVGVWLYEQPLNSPTDVYLEVGGTIVLTEQEVNKIGDGLITVSTQIWDDDTFSDDLVFTDNSLQLGPADRQVGPNGFVYTIRVPRSKVNDSEPDYESTAELYARVKASGGGVTTGSTNSNIQDVRRT
jgi:hypothetical protein